MQVTVFGASGKVGRLVVRQLLDDGVDVVAFIHKSGLPFTDQRLRIVKGSIEQADAVAHALQGSDAVICTLGSWGSQHKSVVSEAMRRIIPAMEKANIARIITVTGSAAFYRADKPNWRALCGRLAFKLLAATILQDGERHLDLLSRSQLDWTCIRAPAMTNGKPGHYRLINKLKPLLATIPRRTVARCLVSQLSDTRFIRQAPTIRRKPLML